MKAKDIKNVHIITRTWFDKVNGNTYFKKVPVFGVLVRGCKKRDLKSTDYSERMGW